MSLNVSPGGGSLDLIGGLSLASPLFLYSIKDPQLFLVRNPNGNHGRYPSLVLTDTLELTIRENFYYPRQFYAIRELSAVVIAEASGNLRWSATSQFGKICDEDYDANSDSVAEQTTAVTLDQLTCLDITDLATGGAAEDLFGIYFTRHADDVLDTIGTDVHFIGFRVQVDQVHLFVP